MDNIKCVEALLNLQETNKINDQIDQEGNSLIHLCAKFNKIESLRYLLKMNNYLDIIFIVNNSGELPLHSAAKNGNIEIFKLILAKFYDGKLITFLVKAKYLGIIVNK